MTEAQRGADAPEKGWRHRAQAAVDGLLSRLDGAQRQFPWLALPIEFVRRWTNTNASVLAGHLAYRVFVFLLPLMLLIVGGLGFAASSGTDIESELTQSSGVGRAVASTLADTGEQAQGGRLQLILFGAFALLLAASGLVKALQLVFATAWGVSAKSGPSRFRVLVRFLPGVLVVLGAVAFRQWLDRGGLVLTLGTEVLSMVVDAIALLALSWVLPRRAEQWTDLLPGAVVGGVGLGLLHIAALVYFPNRLERASALYGTLGVAVVTLLYMFLLGQVLVASALTNAVWLDRRDILREARAPREP